MRIYLDYYRILGLPIQAQTDQLYPAYRDRVMQMPRREYSDLAIAGRKQLLQQAYNVLSHPEERENYDANFLGTSGIITPNIPNIQEIDDLLEPKSPPEVEIYQPALEISYDQFVGTLLILHELGEYEQIIRLARPYLSHGSMSAKLEQGLLGEPELIRPDIVLTVALACLELGREQWQQGQYENAALSLETGQEILLKEGLFASLRGEIALDIFKLRPYRILELLSLPDINETERKTGLQLLKAMLNERGGMEGSGDDQSGLSVDDFLRFIQQLRSYMTAEEQQNLFEIEAIRPSAVATFLAVYALLARGFNQRNPAYIRQAKTMLSRLSQRQDVYIEQAICAMLLGQTDEATEYLQKSQEQETLKFIKEHSENSPDLLPGLCLYGEKWLQSEVFPHFRDLVNRHTALTEYFADEQVQAYLENMPAEPETANDWSIFMPQSMSYNQTGTVTSKSSAPVINNENQQLLSELNLTRNGRVNLTIEKPDIDLNNITTAERIAVTTVAQSNNNINQENTPPEKPTNRRRNRNKFSGKNKQSSGDQSHGNHPQVTYINNAISGHRKRRSSVKWNRLILVILMILFGLGILSVGIFAISRMFQKPSEPNPTPNPTSTPSKVNDAPIPITRVPDKTESEGKLDENSAKEILENWLKIKAKSLGNDHNTEELAEILIDPALSIWKKNAKTYKESGQHWEYQHNVSIKSLKQDEKESNQAQVEAMVYEDGKLYDRSGNLIKGESYQKDLFVRYDLVKKEGKWLIRKMKVLN